MDLFFNRKILQYLAIESLDPYPHWPKMLDPDPHETNADNNTGINPVLIHDCPTQIAELNLRVLNPVLHWLR